ncbi:MAG: hypothetical protein WCI22_04155 [Actinomycetota bacterium]
MSALLAVSWEWELRGTLIVIMAVGVLMGSVYLILGTNLGARLGFLVAFAALAGWMFIMAGIWWTYGKGLLGPDAAWKPVAGLTIVRDPAKLSEVGILTAPPTLGADPTANATTVAAALQADGWRKLDSALPSFQQAGSAGSVLMDSSKALATGEFVVVNVFDKGGERTPVFWNSRIDYFAFFHKPHFSLVEVAPLVPQRAEPGRAPARSVIDTTRSHEYVYMIRDLGARRKPAAIICIGSFIIFMLLCWLLHRRDKVLRANLAAPALPAKA